VTNQFVAFLSFPLFSVSKQAKKENLKSDIRAVGGAQCGRKLCIDQSKIASRIIFRLQS
jgi:hypothetical protein